MLHHLGGLLPPPSSLKQVSNGGFTENEDTALLKLLISGCLIMVSLDAAIRCVPLAPDISHVHMPDQGLEQQMLALKLAADVQMSVLPCDDGPIVDLVNALNKVSTIEVVVVALTVAKLSTGGPWTLLNREDGEEASTLEYNPLVNDKDSFPLQIFIDDDDLYVSTLLELVRKLVGDRQRVWCSRFE